MDFANFLIVRGMPQRQITATEEWRPVSVSTFNGGKVLTFVPRGNLRAAVPAAVLDPNYLRLARLWILEPRGDYEEEDMLRCKEWTLRGKSVLFTDENALDLLEVENELIREGQKVFGRMA